MPQRIRSGLRVFFCGHTDRDPVKLFRRCGSDETIFSRPRSRADTDA
jgi:hypothetical protein